MSLSPERGEVWWADLDLVRGHEQAGIRPVLVVSSDQFNYGRADFYVVLPITRTNRGVRLHVPVVPPEGGLGKPSLILCDQPRAIAAERFGDRIGRVSPGVMARVEDALRILLDLFDQF